jgi:hypothetical protein
VAVTLAVGRVVAADSPPTANVPGADVSPVRFTTTSHGSVSLGDGVRTVVYVFHTQCGHCERQAPKWTTWLQAHPDVRTISVSRESLETGEAFAKRHGWATEVAHVDMGWPDFRTRSFMARTPWVYVVDPHGRIEAAAYAGALDELSLGQIPALSTPHRTEP